MNASSFFSDVEDKHVVDVPVTDIVPVDIDPTTLTDQARRDLVVEVGARGLPEPVCLTADGERDRPPRGIDTSRGASCGDVPIPQGPPYRVIRGQRLISAAEEAGVEKVPAVVYTAQEVEAQVAQLIGRCRRAKRPLKRAELYDALVRIGGLSGTQVASKLDVGKSTVHRYLAVLDFPDSLQRLIRRHKLNVSQGLACAKAPPGKLEQVVQAVLKHGLSTRVIRELVSQVKRFPETPVSELAEEVATTRTSRQVQAAERTTSRARQAPTEKVPIDYGRCTEQLTGERREALEALAPKMQLDGVVVRRAALLMLADPRLTPPAAVAYARRVADSEVGRALTLMELGLARMHLADIEELIPSQRKTASLVLHLVGIRAEEMLEMLHQAPTLRLTQDIAAVGPS